MTRSEIRAIFLANGFTIKPGETDLKPYVYAAAEALMAAAVSRETTEPICVTVSRETSFSDALAQISLDLDPPAASGGGVSYCPYCGRPRGPNCCGSGGSNGG